MSKKFTQLYKGKTSKLIDLCDSITDCHHSTPKWTDEGKIVIRSFNVKKGKLLLDEVSYTDDASFQERISRSQPTSGDIIITREAPMGEVCIIPQGVECCLGQRLVLIKPNLDKINNQYLLYALLSEYVQIQIGKSDNTGSTVSNLRIPDLKNLRIPLNDKQDKIAAVLSALDAKIELNNRINAELENLAKTIYDYWFVQFDFPNADGKPYKSSGGEMVYVEGGGDRAIPAGWKIGRVSDLFEINPSETLSKGTLSAYIDMSAIPTSGFMTGEIQYKPFNGGMKFRNGDVVIARITPCLENGKTGLITLLKDNEIGFGSTEFIVLRGKNRSLSSFAACLSRSTSFRNFAISNMTGTSGRKRVDAKAIERFSIPIPEDGLISQFEDIVSRYFQLLTINTRENQQLTQLRDWLLPMLMNGQVSIK